MHPALEQVDWEREGAAVVELLAALLRFDTTNPPGNEAEAVAFLAGTLAGRGGAGGAVAAPAANLVGPPRRGTGPSPAAAQRPRGVVAAEAGRWRHPPFAGEVHDGLWGRGAVALSRWWP